MNKALLKGGDLGFWALFMISISYLDFWENSLPRRVNWRSFPGKRYRGAFKAEDLIEFAESLEYFIKTGNSLDQSLEMIISSLDKKDSSDFPRAVKNLYFTISSKVSGEDDSSEISLNREILDEKFRGLLKILEDCSEGGEGLSSSISVWIKVQKDKWRADKKNSIAATQNSIQAFTSILVPLFVLVVIYFMDRDLIDNLFASSLGLTLITVGLVFEIIGSAWILYILFKKSKSLLLMEEKISLYETLRRNLVQGNDLVQSIEREKKTSMVAMNLFAVMHSAELEIQKSLGQEHVDRYFMEVLRVTYEQGGECSEVIKEYVNKIIQRMEFYMEKRSLILPYKMMLPVFIFIFPSAFVFIAAPFLCMAYEGLML